jgi:GMP reductase
MKDFKWDLWDISIIPAIISDINSRSECSTRYKENGMLPLMGSPMDTVVCKKNAHTFIDNGIIPCIPRGEDLPLGEIENLKEHSFKAFGLNEIEMQLEYYKTLNSSDLQKIENYVPFYQYPNVLIDMANGNMQRLIDIIKKIKDTFKINLMVGNVANPLTYKNLAMAGADLIRISVGTGLGCTTGANVGIYYPIGSLIHECKKLKEENNLRAKIVMDGGMRGFDDIIKALALGADYILCGSIFNKTMQSAGFNYLYGIKIPYDAARILWKWGLPVKKKYRGMSVKAVQRKWGKSRLVTSEGITLYQKVEYNLPQWVENFEDYLRSCMSYCGVRTLEEFIGNVEWEFISYNSLKRFQK